jgi:hypothetical protein
MGASFRRWLSWFRTHVRWWELAPEALVAGGLTYFLIDETHAATSAFKSERAVALMLGVAVAWVLARVVLARFVRWPLLRVVPFAAAAAVILSVVVLPAYHDRRVVETLTADHRETLGTTTGNGADVAPPAPTVEPVLVRTGMFRGIDHRAEGTVSIYRRADGRHVVGLEAFDIQPGPDYDVYVVAGANRRDRDRGVRIDDLRGNSGTQFYDVPGSVDLESGPWTVLIWCQTFGVPVANATPG